MRRYLGQIQVSAIPPIGLNKTKRTARSYPPTETPLSDALGVRVGDPASGAGWYRKRNPMRIVALPFVDVNATARFSTRGAGRDPRSSLQRARNRWRQALAIRRVRISVSYTVGGCVEVALP